MSFNRSLSDFNIPGQLGGLNQHDRATVLREMLQPTHPAVVVPGVTDSLGAMLVESAGFKACYLSGAGVANTQLGVPDVGILSLPEIVEQARRVVHSCSIPVIVDADTGHGGPIGVMRTIEQLESSGVAAIQLEDQASPKRCGHFENKQLVETEEMETKIRAAVHARSRADLVIIARTDSRAVNGFDAAIERAARFRDAGADVIFFEAPESRAELAAIPERLGHVPLLANMVEGGLTPLVPHGELDTMGYQLILHANVLMRVMAKAGLDALQHIRAHGETESLWDRMLTWQQRQDLVGLETFDSIEENLRTQVRARAAR